MKKALKQLKKHFAELQKLEAKEEMVLEKIEESIEELENCDHSGCAPVHSLQLGDH